MAIPPPPPGPLHVPGSCRGVYRAVHDAAVLGGYRWLNPPDFCLVMGTVTGCLVKWGHRVAEVVEKQGGHVPADAKADQDPLHRDV